MHTLRYVSTNVYGRMRNKASTLMYAEYVRDKLRTRYCTLVYVVIRRKDLKILCLHKKSSAYAYVLLIR